MGNMSTSEAEETARQIARLHLATSSASAGMSRLAAVLRDLDVRVIPVRFLDEGDSGVVPINIPEGDYRGIVVSDDLTGRRRDWEVAFALGHIVLEHEYPSDRWEDDQARAYATTLLGTPPFALADCG